MLDWAGSGMALSGVVSGGNFTVASAASRLLKLRNQ